MERGVAGSALFFTHLSFHPHLSPLPSLLPSIPAAAALHPDESIALAALKFFLGEDAAEAAAGSESDDDGPPPPDRGAGGPTAPSGRDVHRMTNLGTASSKKKKEKKLARVRRAVAKAARKGSAGAGEGFAAIQLLHDPQVRREWVRKRAHMYACACGKMTNTILSLLPSYGFGGPWGGFTLPFCRGRPPPGGNRCRFNYTRLLIPPRRPMNDDGER